MKKCIIALVFTFAFSSFSFAQAVEKEVILKKVEEVLTKENPFVSGGLGNAFHEYAKLMTAKALLEVSGTLTEEEIAKIKQMDEEYASAMAEIQQIDEVWLLITSSN